MTVNIIDFEQGSASADSLYNVRSGYIRANIAEFLNISAILTTGNELQVELLGYSDINSNSVFDLRWYDLPHIFDTSNRSSAKYLKIVLKYKNGSKITPEEISGCTLEINYSWYMDTNGDLHCYDMPYAPEKNMSKPYPSALWRIDKKISELPYHELIPIEIPAGAFMDAKSLEYARIPETVRKIGRYAFANTALKKIRISPECEYYETSFPEDCVVEFYGQSVDEHSGQLFDSENNILIDIDGARVYVKE